MHAFRGVGTCRVGRGCEGARAEGRAPRVTSQTHRAAPSQKHRVAVFVDADNVSHRAFPQILTSVATRLRDKRVEEVAGGEWVEMTVLAYRDWTGVPWIGVAQALGMEPVQVEALPYKNSTDIRMVVDMIDSKARFDTFVLVSNDSDFRHALDNLRASGKNTLLVTCGGRGSGGGSALWLGEHADAHVHVLLESRKST